MSTTNEHGGSNSNGQEAAALEPLAQRRLKSFTPDLEVVVGTPPNQETFQCHGLLLASYSAYIDSMLAIPMREQSTRRVTFPEIDPETWRKALKYLDAGGSSQMTLADLSTVLPVYDKYEFASGLLLCDNMLSGILERHKAGRLTIHDGLAEVLFPTILLAHELNLPKSSLGAVQFSKRLVLPGKYSTVGLAPDHLQPLLPLIVEDDELVRYLTETLMGMECSEMTTDEQRDLVTADGFSTALLARHKEIVHQEEIVRHLNINIRKIGAQIENINVIPPQAPPNNNDNNDNNNGQGDNPLLAVLNHSEYIQKHVTYPDLELPGAMRIYWSRELPLPTNFQGALHGRQCVIRSMDPFGKTWQIRVEATKRKPAHIPSCLIAGDPPETENTDILPYCQVLLEWKSDYTSIVPPRTGWVKFVGGRSVPADAQLEYNIGRA